VPDIHQFQLHLIQIAVLLFPPLPTEMIEHFCAFDPHGTIIFVALSTPLLVHQRVVSVLHLSHGLQHGMSFAHTFG
jgi:hypothetical protein